MICETILKIKSDAKVTVQGSDIDNCIITWHDDNPTDRSKEYPSIVDQLDDIYHNGIDGWKATIKITKDKYPK
jgi:hypothetical protein